MPFKSEQQKKAMYAAASGNSNIGIPKSVAEKFVKHARDDDPGVLLISPNNNGLFLQDDEKNWSLPNASSEIVTNPYGEIETKTDGPFIKHVRYEFAPKLDDAKSSYLWLPLNNNKTAQDTDFEESQHPRAENGQFGSGGAPKKSKLSSSEKSTLSSYSGDAFLKINADLRKGDTSNPEIQRLDSAISKNTIPSGTTLYRGMTKESAKQLFKDGQIDKGQIISDPAFSSTSTKQSIGKIYGGGGVMLKIDVAHDSPGIDMAGYSSNPSENEVLLPRNAKMHVIGISPGKTIMDPIVVHVSYGDDDKTTAQDADFEESKHPRAENGQFGSGSGGGVQEEESKKTITSAEDIHKETSKKLHVTTASDNQSLAFDRASVRSFDEDGRMRVEISNISKAMVCPYYGYEIPNHEELGLDPNQVYQLLRDPEELKKSVTTWNGIPVLKKHVPVSAEDHRPYEVIGATGTDAEFQDPYLVNSLSIWVKDAIDKIESGEQQEISCSYYYDPDMTSGEFNGAPYDGVMRNIRANHVALVDKGRAGPDVLVNDGDIGMLSKKALLAKGALMAVLKPGKVALDSMLTGVTNGNWLSKKPGIIAKVKSELANDADIGDVVKLLDCLDSEQPDDDNLGIDKMDEMVMDEDSTVEDILNKLRGKISDEDLEEIKSMLSSLDKKDEKPAEAPQESVLPAVDAEEDKEKDEDKMDKAAMDKAISVAVKLAESRTIERIRQIHEAEEIVKPYVGKLAAMDSAEDVYRSALKLLNIDVKGVHPSAYKTILQLRPNQNEPKKAPAAQDSALSVNIFDQFPDLK